MSANDLRSDLEALTSRWEQEAADRGPFDKLYTSGVAEILRHLLTKHAPADSE